MHPQQFVDPLWKICAKLEELFGCLVGANCYLTPAGTQGLAPHYDDVDVFIMQLEGSKVWRLYECVDGPLPREYSRDYQQHEIGNPILAVTLEPGDVMYFPRGFIHQAIAVGDTFSHHVTVSTYQRSSWADFMSKTVDTALNKLFDSDFAFRKSLPVGWSGYMGPAYDEDNGSGSDLPETKKRKRSSGEAATRATRQRLQHEFGRTYSKLLRRLSATLHINSMDLHEAANEFMIDFQVNRMAPYLPSSAKGAAAGRKRGEATSAEEMETEEMDAATMVAIANLKPSSRIRFRNPSWARMVFDEDQDTEAEGDRTPVILLFSTLKNDRAHHMDGEHTPDPSCLKFPRTEEHVRSLQMLFDWPIRPDGRGGPQQKGPWVHLRDLAFHNFQDAKAFAVALLAESLIDVDQGDK